MSMLRLGLTGGIGSGKSAAARIFRSLGAYIVDADKISREILKKGNKAYDEITERFGDRILNPDETINRRTLADIVFASHKDLEALNSITHKHILSSMEKQARWAEDSGRFDESIIVLDAPLLFAEDFSVRYDKSLAVTADDEVRIERVMRRDKSSRSDVIARIKNQLTNEELARRADYVIENNTDDLEDLKTKVTELYERLI